MKPIQPQIIIAIPDGTVTTENSRIQGTSLRANYVSQLKQSPEFGIIETSSIEKAVNHLTKDTDKRIKVLLVGLFDELRKTLADISLIKSVIREDVEIILIYMPKQIQTTNGQIHAELFSDARTEILPPPNHTINFPIAVADTRALILEILSKTATN